MPHWQQSAHPSSGPNHAQRGYYPPSVLGFDPRWMMMPPFMDPRMAQGRSPVDYYSGSVHSGNMITHIGQAAHHIVLLRFSCGRFMGGFTVCLLLFRSGVKAATLQDHLNSPSSDEGCHSNLHQESRTSSTEPYPAWNQDYPLRSFTPPYQRQQETSDGGKSGERFVVLRKKCLNSICSEFCNDEHVLGEFFSSVTAESLLIWTPMRM